MESKMFLLEKGQMVVIRNTLGESIGFGAIDEFNLYTDNKWDLSDYLYIDYEPGRDLHIFRNKTDDPGDKSNKGEIPNATFEAIIDTFDSIKEKKTDEFYTLEIDQAKALGVSKVESDCFSKLKDELNNQPFLDQLMYEAGIYSGVERAARNQKIKPILERLKSDKAAILNSKTKTEIKTICEA